MDLLTSIRNKLESDSHSLKIVDLLTNSLLYEQFIYRIFKRKTSRILKSKTYSFAIEVTSFCNARCFFCPNVKMKRVKNIMSTKMLIKIAKRIKDEGIIPKQFNLTGTGEPLIDKELFTKIRILRKHFPESEIFFPTNLALANENIQKKMLSSGLDSISVSLNADNAVDYKKIMGLDYEITIKNLKSLIKLRNKNKSKLKIYLKLAANPVNKDSINRFVKNWEGKVDGIGVSWIHSWAGSIDNGDKRGQSKKLYPCRSLFEQIIIHSNGNIALCCVDYEGRVVGGNVDKNNILSAFYAPNIEKIRDLHRTRKINNFSMCSNCRFAERGMHWLVK